MKSFVLITEFQRCTGMYPDLRIFTECVGIFCILGDTAFIFSIYFPFDLNNVLVSEKGVIKGFSHQEKY